MKHASLAVMLLFIAAAAPLAAQKGASSEAMQTVMNLNAAFQEIASRATPSVVSISSTRPRRSSQSGNDRVINMGSGVIVSRDGYILTNNHVVSGADSIQVTLLDGRPYDARVMGTDHTTDLAVLKINGLEKDTRLPAIKFGNSDSCNIGAWVVAIGNPLELGISVTAGIISAKSRKIDILSGDPLNRDGDLDQSIENFIQTDAVINPGNSGGALINLHGELIGINTAIASRTGLYQGYGFAIPINLARRVMEDLITYGRVIRPVMGVSIVGLDPVQARALGLDKPQGVLIDDFVPAMGSPAELGGIKRGDVILEVEGNPIRYSHQLQETIARFRPGEKVTVTLWRDGKRLMRQVTLGSKEISGESAALTSGTPVRAQKTSTLGIQLRELNEHDYRMLELEPGRGVMIERVSDGSVASGRDVRGGDVLLSIDRQQVNSVGEVQVLLDKIESGSAVLFMVMRDGATHFIGMEIP